MCWISTRKDGKAIAKIAKKDIPVIKIGHRIFNRFASAAYAYEYKMGDLQENIKIEPFHHSLCTKRNYIEKGYHFYRPGMTYMEHVVGTSSLMVCGVLRRGFIHHYLITNTSCIAKGYVPKGTKYYLNAKGEGVAEQIVLTEMINISNCLTN